MLVKILKPCNPNGPTMQDNGGMRKVGDIIEIAPVSEYIEGLLAAGLISLDVKKDAQVTAPSTELPPPGTVNTLVDPSQVAAPAASTSSNSSSTSGSNKASF